MNKEIDKKFPPILYNIANMFLPLYKVDRYLGSPNYCLYTNDTGTLIKRVYIKELEVSYFSNQIKLVKINIEDLKYLIEIRTMFLERLEKREENENT